LGATFVVCVETLVVCVVLETWVALAALDVFVDLEAAVLLGVV
jgi:hypothetical protein